MIALLVAAIAALAALAWAYGWPQAPALHDGWFNAGLIALAAWGWYRSKPRTPALFAANAGVAVLAFAFVANGLLAPDVQVIAGAPGQDVSLRDDAVTLHFPSVDARGTISDAPAVSSSRGMLAIAPQRYTFDRRFALVPRHVVYVQAYDARGGSLTITQPTGAVFLSPVLLMQQRQTITAGLQVPFDSFAVPAAHRLVKAVYFSATQAAALRGTVAAGREAVLFAVDDQNDTPIPHGIAVGAAGELVRVAGVSLRGTPLIYPAIERATIPNIIASVIGLLLLGVAAVLLLRTRSRS